MEFVNVDGHEIRFEEKGKGFPLVLIHGLGASLEWWQYNINVLSQKYRVIAFDFLGFGYSSKPVDEFTLFSASEFLVSFLDTFRIEKAILIGSSMGGLISLSTAIQYKQRVEKLVLVNNAGFGQNLSLILRLASVYPIGELALASRTPQTVKILLSQLFYDQKKLPHNLINCVMKIFGLDRTPSFLLRELRYGVNLRGLKKEIWHSIVNETPSIPHPSLIVWGQHDRIVPVDQAYRGNELIRNSQLYIFKKCGHMPQVEWPDEFNQLVLEYLDS